jgi:hypothetical protein
MAEGTPGIVIDGSDLKVLREALCVAQGAIGQVYRGEQAEYGKRYSRRLGKVLDQIDEARPLGSDGKHGSLHTDVCGCDKKEEA